MTYTPNYSTIVSRLLAILTLTAALLGPLGLKVISFHVSPSANTQYIGGEILSLVVAILLLIFSRASNKKAIGILLGSSLYLIYTFVTVVVGQQYNTVAQANAEAAFFLYSAIIALGITNTCIILHNTTNSHHNFTSKQQHLLSNTFRIASAIIGTLWTMQIVGVYTKPTEEYLADPGLFWLIKLLDFSFLIPIMLLLSVAIHTAEEKYAYHAMGVLWFITLLGCAITAMAFAQAIAGENGAVFVGIGMGISTLALGRVTYSVTPWHSKGLES